MSLHTGGGAKNCASCGKVAKHCHHRSGTRYSIWCDTLSCPTISEGGPGAKERALTRWNARVADAPAAGEG